ncbi:RagB/SusD family nutrient uptake outer membrane protein [Chitinophaga alhagiae]|uniref:RagB/SusD family nutrient uptake outer membrane protein n=1 Tax=Chitinophaga alhagiae TaxID=2203219 RepID=A0ABM6W9Y3_9BACT|nr:RagB/SusD family nutrient uptake outer membrane protein [Chitinophaga alhagiae]AWO00698.1 RagB/SusD family nutrient uptake outer membrane protein [Chitinophaga alhagiae]
MKNFLIIASIFSFLSCSKQNEWLNAKRQASDVVPTTLEDFQAILNNTILMNSNYPTIGLLGCDNFYYADETISSLNAISKNSYLWNKEIFEGQLSSDYANSYNVIASANIVLERLELGDFPANSAEVNNIKGQALFFRAIIFSELASAFCKPYVGSSAATDLGICVRLKSDIYHVEPRSTVQKTYEQITGDLKKAAALLPVTSSYKSRPNKPAAFALLARIYLLMDDYSLAKEYADSSLYYSDKVLDFNSGSVTLTKPYRFPGFTEANDEILFYATGVGHVAVIPDEAFNLSLVDSSLYNSYNDDDLRKSYYYDYIAVNRVRFRGTYAGTGKSFSGLATNEVYFIRAECNARTGDIEPALNDLNKVLSNRYKQGKYTNYFTNDKELLLKKILEERRKEFPFASQIRWQDLRRLNRDARFATTLYRKVFGVIYQLLPNDRRYVYPLPQTEIEQAGLQQNER